LALQPSPIHWIGFSQGAALALTYPLFIRISQEKTAVLSGFIPIGGSQLLESQARRGGDFYISHGTQDDMIPVARAREAVRLLEKANANVSYCEENVGHKTGPQGFKGLRQFFFQ